MTSAHFINQYCDDRILKSFEEESEADVDEKNPMDTSTLHIQQCKDPTKDPQQSFITDANGNPSPSSEFGRLELEKQELERKIHQDPTIKSLKQSYEKNAVVKGEEIYENKTLVLNSELDAVDKVLSRPKKSKVGGRGLRKV